MAPSSEQILTSVAAVLDPSQFVLEDGLRCFTSPPQEVCLAWEVFRGYLLDPRHTREERTLTTWSVYLAGSDDDPRRSALSSFHSSNASYDFTAPTPLISMFWDRNENWLAVTRQILCYDWHDLPMEPETVRAFVNHASNAQRRCYWVRELVGIIHLNDRSTNSDELRRELARYVELAVFGTSRLPITSPETPLPSFSFGMWTYVPDTAGGLPSNGSSKRTIEQAVAALTATTDRQRAARIVEAALRSGALTALIARVRATSANSVALDAAPPAAGMAPLPWLDWLRTLFHHVSLTPITAWTDRALELFDELARTPAIGRAAVCDLVGHMVRHLLRHLTAYDLERFHSFGANYPDALWLDQLLRYLCQQIELAPQLFLHAPEDSAQDRVVKRVRRRALRQAWLVRRHYEGLRVPAGPTSLGEQRRVMPESYPFVSEADINQRTHRPRVLYAESPLEVTRSPAVSAVFQQSLGDLAEAVERRELGLATFLDRPFGIFKLPGAPDRSPLLAYETYSCGIARARLSELQRMVADWPLLEAHQLPSSQTWDAWREGCPAIAATGSQAANLPGQSRQGVIMLEDARVAQPDFRIEWTARSSLQQLADWPWGLTVDQRQQFANLANSPQRCRLIRTASDRIAATGAPWITILDAAGNERGHVQLADPRRVGEYIDREGGEFPAGGIVLTIDGQTHSA